MWSFQAPAAVMGLLALAVLPSASAKAYPTPNAPAPTVAARLDDSRRLKLALAKRQCGNPCGFDDWLCCGSNEQCYTDINNQAGCTAGLASGGYIYSTFVYTEAATVTRTSIWSSFVGGGGAAPTKKLCSSAEVSCGSSCCGSTSYCKDPDNGVCAAIGGGSSGASGPTVTGSPTATLPFESPIPTGVNGTIIEQNQGGGGLSGGAIAGIVIGVLAGIILLLLLCFCCCAKAALDTILACFGFGKKRRHTHEESTYIESHHSGAAGGRRWYGQAGSSRPSRPKKEGGGGLGKMLGIGAGLAGVAALLGMKKKHDRKYDDKSTTVTDSSYYYSDYTSTSSASSDDRRTRHTRHSSRR